MFFRKKKKDEYADVKKGFERICRLERRLNERIPERQPGLPMDWFNKNLPQVKELFLNKKGLYMCYYSDKYDRIDEECQIKDILLEDDNINFKLNGSSIKFYNPSRAFFEAGKGIGNMYLMTLYSMEKIPSQLRLSYYNI